MVKTGLILRSPKNSVTGSEDNVKKMFGFFHNVKILIPLTTRLSTRLPPNYRRLMPNVML